VGRHRRAHRDLADRQKIPATHRQAQRIAARTASCTAAWCDWGLGMVKAVDERGRGARALCSPAWTACAPPTNASPICPTSPYPPRYLDVPSGDGDAPLRMAYVDEGPRDAPVV
jgi:hypothetical protein